VNNNSVRRPLDVMHYEIVMLLVDERFEQILDGNTIGHEFGGFEHKTSRHDDIEQRVYQQRSGVEHVGD